MRRFLLPVLIIAALLVTPLVGGGATLFAEEEGILENQISNTVSGSFRARRPQTGGPTPPPDDDDEDEIEVPADPPADEPEEPEPPVGDPEEPEVTAFADLDGYWAESCIRQLITLRMIEGYPDGTFRPTVPVTRAEAVKIIVTALGLGHDSSPNVFADEVPDWALPFVMAGYRAGVVEGYDDGTFRADRLVSRAEFVALIIRAWPQEVQGQIAFVDNEAIPAWAAEAIRKAVGADLVTGYPDGTFQPDGPVTRGEVAAVICRVLNLSE